MMVEFAFAYLGAETVRSGYAEGNEASRRISAKLGYVDGGTSVFEYKNKRIVKRKLVPTHGNWRTHRPDWLDDMEVTLPPVALTLLEVTHL